MEIRNQIISYLIKEKISTTEVADALGKTGVVSHVMPLNRGHYRVGRVKWVYAYAESNWPLHEQIQEIEEDQVVFVDSFQCGERAVLGELVSRYLLIHHKSRAVVVQGNVRDAERLIGENWPIWCRGCSPIGCFKEKPKKELDSILRAQHCRKYDGGIAVCDDCGVVIIPKDRADISMLNELHCIQDQERIWFDRLDNYTDNTFEIVCQKKYLADDVYMKMQHCKTDKKS